MAGPREGRASALKRLPVLRGLLPVEPSRVPADILAGLTLAAVGLPQAMGYSKIIGVPVVLGLYTLFLPVLAFALFGSSRHLVVAADSATAAMVASALITAQCLAESPKYIALTGLVALVCAAFLLLARLFHLGFLADFLSRTVLTGFLTGVGVQVAVGQLHGVLGIEAGGRGLFGKLWFCARLWPEVNPAALALSVAVMVLILGLDRLAPRFPGALLAVVGAIAASALPGFDRLGIASVGGVPPGLPHVGLPAVGWADIPPVLEVAFSCVVVILAQSAATARAYAIRYKEPYDPNADLLGLCAANVAAGLGGTFVVNGSPTQTATAESAGGRSQLAHLTAALTVMMILLFLTGPLSHLPEAVLASIVFLIGVKLVKVGPMREIYLRSPGEFWVALVAAGTVVAVGVREGILLALVLSLLQHVKRGYRPPTATILLDPVKHWRMAPPEPGNMILPGMVMYWFGGSLYYANAGFLAAQARRLVEESPEPVRWFVLEAGTMPDLDFSAAEALRELVQDLRKRGVVLALVLVSPGLEEDLEREGLLDLIGRERIFRTPRDCFDAYEASAVEGGGAASALAQCPMAGPSAPPR
jgi:SulP family sulfate permease